MLPTLVICKKININIFSLELCDSGHKLTKLESVRCHERSNDTSQVAACTLQIKLSILEIVWDLVPILTCSNLANLVPEHSLAEK